MPDGFNSTAFWCALLLAAVLGAFLLTYIDRLQQARHTIRVQLRFIRQMQQDRTRGPKMAHNRTIASGLTRVK